jgi:hypothetical protein
VCLGFSSDPRQTQDQNAGKSTPYTKPIPSHLPIHREHGLGDYLILLERALPDVSTGDLPRMSDAIGAMVAACLAPEQDRAAAAGLQLDADRLERVRRVVRKYLRSPALGARLLCHSLSMSGRSCIG